MSTNIAIQIMADYKMTAEGLDEVIDLFSSKKSSDLEGRIDDLNSQTKEIMRKLNDIECLLKQLIAMLGYE